jgi:hypothetical protein
MIIIINNQTKYRTSDLRRLFTKALNVNDKIEGKADFRRLHIKVVYGKYTGNAYIGIGTMRIRIPNYINSASKERNSLEIDSEQLAWLFTHEFYHCRGFKHKPLSESIMYYSNIGEWDWAAEYQIRKPVKKEKLKGEDLRTIRYLHVCKMADKKQRQIKRLQNQLKKWNVKKRYYERLQMAASNFKKQQQ